MGQFDWNKFFTQPPTTTQAQAAFEEPTLEDIQAFFNVK